MSPVDIRDESIPTKAAGSAKLLSGGVPSVSESTVRSSALELTRKEEE